MAKTPLLNEADLAQSASTKIVDHLKKRLYKLRGDNDSSNLEYAQTMFLRGKIEETKNLLKRLGVKLPKEECDYDGHD